MNHHCINIVQKFIQAFTAGFIVLNNLQIHVVGSCQCHAYSRLAATHNDDVLDVGIVLLATNLSHIVDILAGSHQVGQVVDLQLIVTTRNQCLAFSLDSHHMIGVVRSTQVL